MMTDKRKRLCFQGLRSSFLRIAQNTIKLVLVTILGWTTFFASAQTPYPCDKDSIDMTTNELWLNELEKLLPPLALTQNKLEILARLKQRINCDTNRISKHVNLFQPRLCGLVRLRPQLKDTVYGQLKSSYIPLYVVNMKPIDYRCIHLIINSLQEKQLLSCWVLGGTKAPAMFGIRALAGAIVMNIENLLLQGNQIILQTRKVKKNKVVLHIQSNTKQRNVKVIFTPFFLPYSMTNEILTPLTYYIILKKGKNRLKLANKIGNGLYTIYLNGKKEIEFFE
jgi:hypothetical protein